MSLCVTITIDTLCRLQQSKGAWNLSWHQQCMLKCPWITNLWVIQNTLWLLMPPHQPKDTHRRAHPDRLIPPVHLALVLVSLLHLAKKDVPQSQTPLANAPSLPPYSPSAPLPCSPPGVSMLTDTVQEAGYASLPDSQGSNRITKVCNIKHKADRKHASGADSPPIM